MGHHLSPLWICLCKRNSHFLSNRTIHLHLKSFFILSPIDFYRTYTIFAIKIKNKKILDLDKTVNAARNLKPYGVLQTKCTSTEFCCCCFKVEVRVV